MQKSYSQNMKPLQDIKLTQYSHGAGCGCKISPKILDVILKESGSSFHDPRLLVGHESRDDAAVYDMGDGTAIISTTDFFMPIVDDPFIFGRIAAANAISDVYAMGGKPLLAIAILGWPVSKLDPEIAGMVVDGGRQTCREAGISLAGGHSIDSPEPIFGLAVTGQVYIKALKKNNTATAGCRLYLTKPLGVGILTTAQKQGKLKAEHAHIAPEWMMKLNGIGQDFGRIPGITAMTDVTGFGLLGHLSEMCLGSNLSAVIEYSKIPLFSEAEEYILQNCIPGGTGRNWESYGHQIKLKDENWRNLLADPQTSGGLLIAVREDAIPEVEKVLADHRIIAAPFGYLVEKWDKVIEVI
jgi:selenide,water dikinase